MIVQYNESNALLRRVRFDIRGLDGLTPATGEAGGQPQISVNDGAWTNTGISVLSAIGNGRYYATVDQSVIATPGIAVQSRFKSGSTVETPGESLQVVGYDPNGYQGTGARTINLTVTDGTDPLESATVRLTKGAISVVGVTDSDGLIVFHIDDGEWDVAITLVGYGYPGGLLVVFENADAEYEMTVLAVTPSNPGFITGFLICYDKLGAVEPNVNVLVTTVEVGVGDTGFAYDNTVRTVTSDDNGLVTVTNLFPGVTYFFRRGTTKKDYTVTIPADAESPYALPSIIGSP